MNGISLYAAAAIIGFGVANAHAQQFGGAPYGSPYGYAGEPAYSAGPAPYAGGGYGAYGAPGGYEARMGQPYANYGGDPGVITGNPYYDHYGPGFQRHSLHGHYRFPYYNYRAPWYYPGRAQYNRDTNFHW